MRVSDAERQAAAERLRVALADGRLDFLEYDVRLAKAFEAVTYADLDKLFTDLPVSGKPSAAAAVAGPTRPAGSRPVPAVRTGTASLPVALKILWSIWSVAVLINLTVWLLVSLGTGGPEYFWPMWMAVPGVALFGATAVVQSVRSHK
jgi:Domain of unknown function (DUF1707)